MWIVKVIEKIVKVTSILLQISLGGICQIEYNLDKNVYTFLFCYPKKE